MKHRIFSKLLLLAAMASITAPVSAGELIIPLSSGTAPDGSTYGTRVWVTNTGGVARRLSYTFIAPGANGTQATTRQSSAIAPGATILATNLVPAGQNGMLLLKGAPQLQITPRVEAHGPNGALRAAAAGPLVGDLQLAPGGGSLHLHGLSQKNGGLTTDLYLINASRKQTQCTVNAFRDNGSQIVSNVRYTLPALSVKVVEKALVSFGANDVDEARVAVTCQEAFYAWSRVYKPGGAELNVMTPARPLGQNVATATSK